MKKLLFAILLTSTFMNNATAKVTEIRDKANIPQAQELQKNHTPEVRQTTIDKFTEFLSDRVNKIVQVDEEEFKKTGQQAINTVLSEEAQQAKANANKSNYEKMYEQAIIDAI